MIEDVKFSNNKSDTVRRYIVPKAVALEYDATNAQHLTKDDYRQTLLFSQYECCILNKGSYVVLDMGCEIHGGISITTEKQVDNNALRITFGESLMEALSTVGVKNSTVNHSSRDVVIDTDGASTIEFGNTGYRFVKVESLKTTAYLKTVQGIFVYRDIEYKGSFECNDEKINQIWKTSAYTVHLNMQDYIWDGIKRDRLVWLGDLNPEILTICSVFGYDDVVPKSLDLGIEMAELNGWMNTIPSYTCWWVIDQYDWYMQNGDKDYLKSRSEYLFQTLEKIISNVKDNGELTLEYFFCDWSSRETPDEVIGTYGVAIKSLLCGKNLCEYLGNNDLAEKCEKNVEYLLNRKFTEFKNKQTASLYALAGGIDCNEISNKLLLKNRAEGLSTFLAGYVLRTLAKAGYTEDAVSIMREYWGTMLDLGATTFWEDFDMDWVTDKTVGIDKLVPDDMVDVHGDFGKYCYTQFRHSLCHGWASGPASFLSQVVTGIEILEPGCKKVRIKPDLGGLKYIKTKYPTPYGIIEVEAEEGKEPKIIVPEGIELV